MILSKDIKKMQHGVMLHFGGTVVLVLVVGILLLSFLVFFFPYTLG